MKLLQEFPNLNLIILLFIRQSKQTTMIYFVETETETVEVLLAISEVI